MATAETPTWIEIDRALSEELPEVRSKLDRVEWIPEILQSYIRQLPDGSPFATITFYLVSGFLIILWMALESLDFAALAFPIFFVGIVGLGYFYLAQVELDHNEEGSDLPAVGGKRVSDRSTRGKVEVLIALIPGALLTMALGMGLLGSIGWFAMAYFAPLPGVPVFLLVTLGPFYLGGYLRDRGEKSEVVAQVDHWIETLWKYQFIRDVVSIPAGALISAISILGMFVMIGLALGILGGIIRSPELIPVFLGAALAYFGFVTHELFLRIFGWILGLVVGGIVGFTVLPFTLTSNPDLIGVLTFGVITAAVGSSIGAALLPLIHKLGIQIGGFFVGSVSTYFLLIGFAPGLETWLTIGMAGVVGIVMAVIVWWAFIAYIVVATSFLGSMLLGGLLESFPLGIGVFITGILFQWWMVSNEESQSTEPDPVTV